MRSPRQAPPAHGHEDKHNEWEHKGNAQNRAPQHHWPPPPAGAPTPRSDNYTPTFTMPFGGGGPRFPTAPGSWGFGPHAAAYQCANNIPPPQPGTAMMANTMAFNNAYPFPTATPTTVPPPPSYGFAPPPANANPVWFNNF